jgi:hypothetical protein
VIRVLKPSSVVMGIKIWRGLSGGLLAAGAFSPEVVAFPAVEAEVGRTISRLSSPEEGVAGCPSLKFVSPMVTVTVALVPG